MAKKKSKKAKKLPKKSNQSNTASVHVNYDYVTAMNLLEEVKKMKMNPHKHLTEELCIQYLKESPTYEYKIVRIYKETL